MTYYILNLLLTLIERFGAMLAMGLFVLSLTPLGKLGVIRKPDPRYRLVLAVIFGCFGILGTYGGDVVYESYANLRGVSVITAGLLGGPVVGFGAGLIAGGHRFLIDPSGFSSLPCGLATFLEGCFAGWVFHRLRGNSLNWRVALLVGLVGETTHQIMVLTMAQPFDQALALVKVIAIPMISVNTFGAVLFVQSLHMLFEYRSRRDSSRIHQILDIANKTVGHLRSGLNRESARATASIIWERVPVAAVDIADTTKVLAHIGAGDDHHVSGKALRTRATRKVLRTGAPVFLGSREEIGCDEPGCPLSAAIIVPMRKGGRIVGALKLYGTEDVRLDEVHFELAKGLADLFSTQLELEDIQIKNQLLARAEIRRLQTQINPHFLFNALNTIGSFCRTKPERARALLSELALYMRRNLGADGSFAPLRAELEQVRSYLEIEKARFGERIRSELDVAPDLEDCFIPSLIIQPLVENGVKHGILGREQGGLVRLRVRGEHDLLTVDVEDDGVGIERSRVDALLNGDGEYAGNDHIGVRNCNSRLEQIYGPEHTLRIESRPGQGTRVSFTVPRRSAL
ncbi:LytS/YhcK type 5TM receptor domain-containing protein [Paucidesulfovibrio longus]|uniref:LytS/YhcK type 5TM receptor domain-containing protein n=1 Tax=Paucidesulfovibrio longus TaxID=889 RepID=UPI0003B394C4|nr:LytS/YhcK type 5TM receptor domain-containing protein [Paucidesulfovibrio longus]